MSYDVYLEIDTGGIEPATVAEVGNYTSNVSPMWSKALPPDGIAGLHGKLAGQVAESVEAAIQAMSADWDAYAAMNPENGWGDVRGAHDYLVKLAAACLAHPRATIKVSR